MEGIKDKSGALIHPEIAAVLSGESQGCVVCGDSLEILPELPEKSVDLVLTDPPYGINYNREGEPQGKHIFTHRRQIAPVIGDNEQFDPQPLLRFDRLILWGANCYASRLPDRPAWLVWDKVTRNGLRLRIAECEIAWTNCIQRPQVFRHLWSGAYRESENGDYFHPTQKPIALMAWCLLLASKPGSVILDPFCGSGTTCVAAKMLGRRYIGIEISEDYCRISRERLEAVDTGVPVKEQRAGQMALFG